MENVGEVQEVRGPLSLGRSRVSVDDGCTESGGPVVTGEPGLLRDDIPNETRTIFRSSY